MKIVFVLRHVGVFRHFDAVIRELCANGHTVYVLSALSRKAQGMAKPLQTCQAEVENCRIYYQEPGKGIARLFLSQIREILNSAIYFNSKHPSPALVKRRESYLVPPLRFVMSKRAIRDVLVSSGVQKLLRKIEEIIPPDKGFIKWLEKEAPDVVVASPFVFGSSLEIEYVKAAKDLGIPTIVALASWDNLTTKGTFHIYPDHVLVWNHSLLKEVVEIHNVPKEIITVTGAPTFDAWFDMNPKFDLDALCKQVGIDPKRPFLVYLSSSSSIAGDETPFVTKFAVALRENERTRKFHVLVRPHPLNASIWDSFSMENVTIWPPGGDIPDTPESKQAYYDMLYHCQAVVGVNTSAFLEAAIVDKSCLTIMTDDYRHSQIEMGHFHHLLKGDFIEIAASFSDAAENLADILDGEDRKSENRRRFVRDFIRPLELRISASHIMAKMIEASEQ